MSTKLFIGSLSILTTEEMLRQLFSQYGRVVSLSLITDRITGKSRGFGFVEMETGEVAQDAIAKLNGFTVDGRTIVVKEALPKTTYKGMNDTRGFSARRMRRY